MDEAGLAEELAAEGARQGVLVGAGASASFEAAVASAGPAGAGAGAAAASAAAHDTSTALVPAVPLQLTLDAALSAHRPVAITKWGPRHFIESRFGVRLFIQLRGRHRRGSSRRARTELLHTAPPAPAQERG